MSATGTRTCPHCGGEIKTAAKLCKHCRQGVDAVQITNEGNRLETPIPAPSTISFSGQQDPRPSTLSNFVLLLVSGVALLLSISFPDLSLEGLPLLKLYWPLIGGIFLLLAGVFGVAFPTTRIRIAKRWCYYGLLVVVAVGAIIGGVLSAKSFLGFLTSWHLVGDMLIGAVCIARIVHVQSSLGKKALGVGVVISVAGSLHMPFRELVPVAFLMFASRVHPSLVFVSLGTDVAVTTSIYLLGQWIRQSLPSRRLCVVVLVAMFVYFFSWIIWAVSPIGGVNVLTHIKIHQMLYWVIGAISGGLLLREFALPDEIEPGDIVLFNLVKQLRLRIRDMIAIKKISVENAVNPIDQTLQDLKRMHDEGLITEEEYLKKREEVLSRI